MKHLILIICFIAGASEVRADSYITIEANVATELAVNQDHWEGD